MDKKKVYVILFDRFLQSSINMNLFYYLDELVSKAPLCKGSWHGACEVTEGLLIGANP